MFKAHQSKFKSVQYFCPLVESRVSRLPILERMISLPQYKARPTAALGIDIMYFICWSDAIYILSSLTKAFVYTPPSRSRYAETKPLIYGCVRGRDSSNLVDRFLIIYAKWQPPCRQESVRFGSNFRTIFHLFLEIN